MTAVLPPRGPVPPGPRRGRHAAPDAATTGSLGPIPPSRSGREAHGTANARSTGERQHRRSGRHGDPRPPVARAARTAGFSLAALGALAGAGGAATHGLLPAAEPALTGETPVSASLAAGATTLGAPAPAAAPAITAVMPVVAAAPAVAPASKTTAASARPVAAPAGDPEESEETSEAEESEEDEDTEGSSGGSSVAAEAISVAEDQLGTPYEWGGTSPGGFDCSGLMQYAYEAAGVDLPRTSAAQAKEGEEVSMDELQPGDLLFMYSPVSHVAMYVGDGRVIEAPNSGKDVRFNTVEKIEGKVTGARRVV